MLRAGDITPDHDGWRLLRCECGRLLLKEVVTKGKLETFCKGCGRWIEWVLEEGRKPVGRVVARRT